jgi:hypothetical protein
MAGGSPLPAFFCAHAGLPRADDGPGAVGDPQLGEEVRDVVVRRLEAQEELAADLREERVLDGARIG